MNQTRLFHGNKLAIAIALCSTAYVGAAFAAEAIEEVTVTGSYIQRPADRPQPVTVINNEDLRLQQRGSMAEVFKNLPQSIGSTSTINTQQGGVNAGNTPTATINLRGLGPSATLVLLNGNRQTTDGGFGYVDINNLTPSIMVERVEIVTDGASALYGSDAVAGVANFITRNRFEGMEMRTELQKIQDSPGSKPDLNLSFIMGGGSGNTHVVAGLDYASTEPFLVQDRYDDARLRLGLTSGFGNPATFGIRNTNGALRTQTVPDPLCGSAQLGGGLGAGELNAAGNQCLMFNALNRALQPESQRIVGLSVLTHDFNATTTGELEFGFARTRYSVPFGYVVPAGVTTFQTVPVDNPGVLAAIAANPNFPNPANDPTIASYTFRGRVMSPVGGPSNNQTTGQDTIRFAARLNGQFSNPDWGWRLAFSDSRNNTKFASTDTIVQRLANALNGYGGPSCVANVPANRGVGACQFWNPFANSFLAKPGDANYNDPELTKWLVDGRTTNDTGELRTYDAIVNGKLWEMAGGTTGVAFGLSRREQIFAQDWDTLSNSVGNWAFNGASAYLDFDGQINTNAAFAELVMFPTDTLEVQMAARYEDAGAFSSTDPKIGVLYRPQKGLFLRASAGTSFRQPGPIQVNGSGPGGSSTDQIGGDTINARGLVVGNKNLQPETSKNWTAGFTWDVTDALTVDMNYWSVRFQNLITAENAQAILQLDRADGFITDPHIQLRAGAPNEICEVTGRWQPPATASNPRPVDCMSGFDIQLITTSYINQAFQNTSGIDYNISYDFDALNSRWIARLLGTWTQKYEMDVQGNVVDGVGSYNSSTFGSPMPEWRTNLSLDWKHQQQIARATVRYVSKLRNDLQREVAAVMDAALDHFPGTRKITAREIEQWL
ncbi:MAG: TonB-dependent receptor, partial [Pseudomonadales bacterium]|nr:TonB-dependent receptor [Pseudomonadales bacterium]